MDNIFDAYDSIMKKERTSNNDFGNSMGEIRTDNINIDSISNRYGDDLNAISTNEKAAKIYETNNIENPNVAAFIEKMEVVKYANGTLNRSASDAFNSWNHSNEVEAKKAEKTKATSDAKEIAGAIDVDSLSNSDYEQMFNATINANSVNGRETLDSYAERVATMRHLMTSLPDKTLAELMETTVQPSQQIKFIEEAKDKYPDYFPSKEEMQSYTDKIKTELIETRPRTDLSNMGPIKKNMMDVADKAYIEHQNEMKGTRESTRDITHRFENTIDELSSTYSPSYPNPDGQSL